MINTGKNTPIIDSNDEKRITSQTKIDEIVLHPMHGAPPPSRPVGFWNLKPKFECCGGCHRPWNGFYTWNRRENVYEKLMKTPSNPQFSPFGPIKCREKTLINTKFLNSKVCFGGPRSYWNTPKITWFIKKPSRLLHFQIFSPRTPSVCPWHISGMRLYCYGEPNWEFDKNKKKNGGIIKLNNRCWRTSWMEEKHTKRERNIWINVCSVFF